MKILVAMSGGVDSAVAALLLREQGHDISAVTMDIGTVNSAADIAQAGKICAKLDIPHLVLDLKKEFRENVLDYFVDEYRSGHTPNPCVRCNKTIKMGALVDKGIALGFDYLATGHYARVMKNEASGLYELHKGLEERKDQSYFLYYLNQDRLQKLVFPLGDYKDKRKVKEMATQHGLTASDRKESQDACFLTDTDHLSFIAEYTGRENETGYFLDMEGKVLGRHDGFAKYTVGQRKGIGISAPHPLFVISKNSEDLSISLGYKADLDRRKISLREINLINPAEKTEGNLFDIKLRYSPKSSKGRLFRAADSDGRGHYFLELDENPGAAAPGQSAVFYEGSRLVGGGVIV